MGHIFSSAKRMAPEACSAAVLLSACFFSRSGRTIENGKKIIPTNQLFNQSIKQSIYHSMPHPFTPTPRTQSSGCLLALTIPTHPIRTSHLGVSRWPVRSAPTSTPPPRESSPSCSSQMANAPAITARPCSPSTSRFAAWRLEPTPPWERPA